MEQIGRYRIIEELGRGAMGIVYKALDPAIGRTVAVKTIRLSEFTEASERERLRERLFREAQLAGVLSHPGIVTIYDVAEERDVAYIFMEFVNGQTLETLLTSEDAPDSHTLLQVLRQTAAALDYAHAKGIVHRDIKPANIMIREDGTAKIADFGVARIASQQMTLGGAIMGTPNYMSPEQIQGEPADGRTDQFALGVISYELLTGEKPFIADSIPSLLFKIVREEPVPPQRLNPTLPAQVEAVLRRVLAKDPRQRYSTCMEFVSQLSQACGSRPGWKAMPRGSSQSMPTLATAAAAVAGGPSDITGASAPPPPRRADSQPVTIVATPETPSRRRARRRDEEEAAGRGINPFLVAMVVAVSLGAVFFAASQGWFRGEPDEPVAQASPPGPLESEPQGRRPSPTTDRAPEAMQPVPADQTAAVSPEETAPQDASGGQPDPAESGAARAAEEESQEQPAAQTAQQPPAPTPPAPIEKVVQAPPAPPSAPAKSSQPVKQITPDPEPPARGARPLPQAIPITSNPSGARVLFNQAGKSCVTPCTLTLPPGRHTVSATLAGHRQSLRILEVPEEATLSFEMVRMMGSLMIRTKPAGAAIYINGQLRAEKTPAMIRLPVGSHKLALVKDGYRRIDDVVQIKDGVISDMNFDW